MLRQQRLEVAGKVRAAGEELDAVLLLGVGDGAAAQKSRPDVGADAGLAADEPGVDLQARLGAGGAEKLMHPRHLLRCADAELIHHPAGALLPDDLALHTAACKQLRGHLRGQLLLRLKHQPAGVKILGKAGDAVGGGTDAAVLL